MTRKGTPHGYLNEIGDTSNTKASSGESSHMVGGQC